MSRLTELLRRLEKQDPAMARELTREYEALSSRRSFGLNFERHVPESAELPNRRIRRGDKVRFLAARGESDTGLDDRLWRVRRLSGKGEERTAHLVETGGSADPEETSRLVHGLVVVAEFREPIYPALVSTGNVERGGDKPFHTVINGENYHALEALLFAYEGKVDCIYIDPPYNTRDKDWKYNNDYVDSDDAYRHSKWLAMMERRLKLAKRLLNPADSVLIVTIDENEYLHLGLLLEQIFPGARTQMVSSVINQAGSSRPGGFARTDEYIYFVKLGESVPKPLPLGAAWMTGQGNRRRMSLYWNELLRTGPGARRVDSPNLFFPIYLSSDAAKFHSVGSALPVGVDRETVTHPEGVIVRWPIRSDGSEGRWRMSPNGIEKLFNSGHIRLGRARGENTTIQYLSRGEIAKLERGVFNVTGRRKDGSVEVDPIDYEPVFLPGSQWNIRSHDASQNGSGLVKMFVPNRNFPFPKSLYAVEDALRFFVSDKPNSVTLDFFAGSGTTAHAVMRLNKQDGGQRRSIMVTNNEVSAEDARSLRKGGYRPGDPEWEAQGICEYVTKPRIKAAITGTTPEGKPISGDYRFTDEFPMAEGFEENAEFFDLTYEDPERVRYDLAFSKIAPLLWMRAGSEGRRIDAPTSTFDVADTYAVLFDIDAASCFVDAVRNAECLRIAYIVTDDERQYQVIAGELPDDVEVIRLYEAYLGAFRINTGEY